MSETAIQSIKPIDWEAVDYCRRRGIEDAGGYEKVRRMMFEKRAREAAKPFMDMICEIYSLVVPKYTMYQNGKFETIHELPESLQAKVDILEGNIKSIYESHGLKLLGEEI